MQYAYLDGIATCMYEVDKCSHQLRCAVPFLLFFSSLSPPLSFSPFLLLFRLASAKASVQQRMAIHVSAKSGVQQVAGCTCY